MHSRYCIRTLIIDCWGRSVTRLQTLNCGIKCSKSSIDQWVSKLFACKKLNGSCRSRSVTRLWAWLVRTIIIRFLAFNLTINCLVFYLAIISEVVLFQALNPSVMRKLVMGLINIITFTSGFYSTVPKWCPFTLGFRFFTQIGQERRIPFDC